MHNPERQLTSESVIAKQLEVYNNPEDDSGYGIGPMQDALIEFRKQIAISEFTNVNSQDRSSIFLDVGCGHGWVTEALNLAGLKTIGLDIAQNRLVSRSRIENPHSRFVVAKAQEIPFASSSVRGIAAFEIFEHLLPEDAKTMLKEFYRVLEPCGIVILSTPNKNSISYRIRQGIGTIFPPAKTLGIAPRDDHFNEVDYQELQERVKGAGFEVKSADGIGVLPFMWKLQKHIPRRVHDWNIQLGKSITSIASATLVIAQKPA